MSNNNESFENLTAEIVSQSSAIVKIDEELKKISTRQKVIDSRRKIKTEYTNILESILPLIGYGKTIALPSFNIAKKKDEKHYLYDKNAGKTYAKLSSLFGSLCILFCGVLVLSAFVALVSGDNIPSGLSTICWVSFFAVVACLILALEFYDKNYEQMALRIHDLNTINKPISLDIPRFGEIIENTLLTDTQLNLFRIQLQEYLETQVVEKDLTYMQKKELLNISKEALCPECSINVQEVDSFCSRCGVELK